MTQAFWEGTKNGRGNQQVWIALKVASEAFVNRDVELAESVLQVKGLRSCLLPLRECISFVTQTTE